MVRMLEVMDQGNAESLAVKSTSGSRSRGAGEKRPGVPDAAAAGERLKRETGEAEAEVARQCSWRRSRRVPLFQSRVV